MINAFSHPLRRADETGKARHAYPGAPRDCYGCGALCHRYPVQDITACWGFSPRQGRAGRLYLPLLLLSL